MAVNLVIFQGNLGQPPKELTTRRNERACILNIACNESFTDHFGERMEATTWAGVSCYGAVSAYVLDVIRPVPGDELLIEGKLNSYAKDDRGQRRAVLQIVAKSVRLLKKSTAREDAHFEDAPAGEPHPADDDVPF